VTPITIAIYAIKVQGRRSSSRPIRAAGQTTNETVRVMRAMLERLGAPADLLQCVERPSIPLASELMSICDLTIATRRPGHGQGGLRLGQAGLRRRRRQRDDGDRRNRGHRRGGEKYADQQDQRSRVRLLRRRQPDRRRLDLRRVPETAAAGRRLSGRPGRAAPAQAAYWTPEGHRTADTIARPAAAVAARAGFALPEGKSFLIVEERNIGREHPFSTEKLGTVLAIFKADGFDHALDLVRQIFDTAGKGHSCGIYSFDDDHIHRLALAAPVSRIMVRQVQSSSNAGTFTNGMPMTSSMGCGVWGGNITNENISLKHYMNVTWVSRPIAEDRPSEQELFGEFYNSQSV
jgi:sulfoacetaldehyde dehydrogenase